MKYTSQNGCFFYYDRDTYSWELCEPTLMFLLGFEAITMYDKAKSDHLLISNKIYNTKTGVVDDMPDFPIYDDALNYLSSLGQIEDNEYYAQYNCYGLKLLMNELTGTGVDRTVPVIFLNDVNRKLVDPNKYPYADKAGKSYYDLQSTLILNVFKYAGYDTLDTEVPYISESTYGRDYSNLSNDNVPPLRDEIVAYNSSLRVSHEEKQAAGQVYKLLDYKAMYLYALGVLYGLRCMCYDGKMIWRFNPDYWYFDKYKNLVKTAWAVFRFHYSHSIYELDTPEDFVNKYKAIQYNKLWNFMNSEATSDVELYNNEVFAYGLFVREINTGDTLATNRVEVRPIIYLYPSDDDLRDGSKGNFIEYLTETHEWSEPKSVIDESDPLVSHEEPLKGIVAADSDYYIRYIAHNKVKIYKALRYSRNISQSDEDDYTILPRYLSPNDYSLKNEIIHEDIEVTVIEVDGKSYKVVYDEGIWWISSLYTTDETPSEIALNEGEFALELFDVEPYEGSDGIKVTTISDTPVRYLPGDNMSYFISTGNFGWTDFDLTYWKRFKRYKCDEYAKSDIGEYLKKQDAESHSVLSMNEQEFADLYPSRINNAFSLSDGTAIAYYKCNVTGNTYLYGIFDGNVTHKPISEDQTDPDALDFSKVNNQFKYILSSLDFNNMYVAGLPEGEGWTGPKEYYNIKQPVYILVREVNIDAVYATASFNEGTLLAEAKIPGSAGNSLSIMIEEGDPSGFLLSVYNNDVLVEEQLGPFNTAADFSDASNYVTLTGDLTICDETSLEGGKDSENGVTVLWNGQREIRLDYFGYTGSPADAIDAYYYNTHDNSKDPYDLRKYDNKYWSHEFEVQPDSGYGEYREWVSINDTSITKDGNTVYVATGEVVTLYRNVRKLFVDTPYHSPLEPGFVYNDYICNTNESYRDEFGQYYDSVSEAYFYNMPLGFIRYQDLHDRLGITTYLCSIVETDPNGDSLIIDGIPYVWQDPVNNYYWNEFERTWQTEIPLRRNAVAYDDDNNVLVRITDNPVNRTVSVVDGVTLTYEEFYIQYPHYGILRDHTARVFGTEHTDEGIIDCYYDTKMLDDENEHIICILDPSTGECRVPWTKRSLLKDVNYWIVDGTATLYNGEDVTRTAYDDDHKD